MPLTSRFSSQKYQTAFHLRCWTKLVNDRELAHLTYRIQTDRLGSIIVTPPFSDAPPQIAGVIDRKGFSKQYELDRSYFDGVERGELFGSS